MKADSYFDGMKRKVPKQIKMMPDAAKPLKLIGMQLVVCVISFFMARVGTFATCNPFGLAVTAAVPVAFAPAAAVGAAVGYFLSPVSVVPLRYVAALFAVLVIRRAFALSKKLGDTVYASALTAFISCIVSGAALGLALDSLPNSLLLYTAESLLCGGTVLFFGKAINIVSKSKTLRGMRVQDLSCVMISAFFLLMGLATFTIAEISPARMIGVFIILISARYGKASAGAIAGVACGIAMGIAFGDMNLTFAYALGGVLAGLAAETSPIASAIALALSGGLAAVLASGAETSLAAVYEMAVIGVIYAILPERAYRRFRFLEADDTVQTNLQSIRNSATVRLRFASNTLGEVALSVQEVSKKLDKLIGGDMEGIYYRVRQRTCEKCGLKLFCWEQNKEMSQHCFERISEMLQENRELTPETLPQPFAERCIKPQAMIKQFGLAYNEHVCTQLAEQRISNVREVVTEQFAFMGELLSDLALELEQSEVFDQDQTERVRRVFDAFDIHPKDTSCLVDSLSRMKVVLHCENLQGDFSDKMLLKALGDACSKVFERPAISAASGEILVVYYEQAVLTTDTGACQFNAENAVLCGDAYEIFNDTAGRQVIVLSDGMGKGGFAAVDGAMASGIISKLTRAGFGTDSALRVANSALMVKSTEESFSTVDMACIDLFSGRVDFYKAGATCSFIRRAGRAGRVELASLPIGILREAEFAHTFVTLNAGDIILVVSDGVTDGNYEWILAELESWRDGSAQMLSEHIAKEASRRQYEVHEDDITVVSAILKE